MRDIKKKILYKIGYISIFTIQKISLPFLLLFLSSNNKGSEPIFLITSTINFNKKKLVNNTIRSDFDVITRYEQTIGTINSIRSYVPHAKIVLLENSSLTLEQAITLDYLCDGVYNFSRDPIATFFRDYKNKGAGEVYMLAKYIFLNNFKKNSIFIKISGRYLLSENFSLSNFNYDRFNFYKNNGTASTRLYAVPVRYKFIYIYKLIACLYASLFGISIEAVIDTGLKKLTNYVELIGVCGFVGVNKAVFISE